MSPRSLASRLLAGAVAAGLAGVLAACGPADQSASSDGSGGEESDAAPSGSYEDGTLTVVAEDFGFDAPREVPSGWTSIRLQNVGEQNHFVYVYRLPDDVDFSQYRQEVVQVFSRVWNRYSSGRLDREGTLAALGEQLPEWFVTEVVPSGGVALLDPGATATSTVRLEPGTYALECYVKTPDGTWHTDRGMVRELRVTGEESGLEPPEPDATVTLSNYEIRIEGELTVGEQTVEVRAADTPEGLMKHDLNLVRLDDSTTVEQVVEWMDWMDLDRFRSPAPGENLGGVEHLAEGRTGYMAADLDPGRYLLLSEEYASRGMVEELTIE
ncbi:MAG: hypothetical protein ACOC83_01930 [Gemmatimonadota bacterium]